MKKLLKRINLIKKYLLKNDKFPYPTKELETMYNQSNNKKNTFQVIKKELFKYWDFIAGLALGGILNCLTDEEKREGIKEGLNDESVTFLQDLNVEDYEGFNNTYMVYETTRTMLIDLIDDYENDEL